MPIRAILFDLDGTLLDTLDDIASCVNRVLGTHGFPTHSLAAFRFKIGNGVRNLITAALPEEARTPALINECIGQYAALYAAHWHDQTHVYAGIPELLAALTTRGGERIPLVVLSNKPHDATVDCVRYYFPGVAFDIVLGATERFPHKPDPAAALHIAARLGISPADFAYLGDTNTDMQTAVNAGMQAIGVLWGFREESELRAAGARILLAHPHDLLGLLGS